MSLLRLLSAGKSLVGIKEEPARYRMSDPRVMPRFGSGRNPFQSRKSSGSETPAVATPVPEAEPAAAPTTPAVETVEAAQAAQPVTEPPVAVRPSRLRLKPRLSGLFGAVGRLFRRRARSQSVVTRRAGPGPVQGELSLDLVRVVRNDLSDSDFEVVTRKPVPASVPPVEAKAVELAGEEPGPRATPETVESARSRMATRLFCAGKS